MTAHGTDERDQEILDSLARIEQMTRENNIRLWGSPEAERETKDGRIPRIEAKAENHGHRISRLERWRWVFVGMVVSVGALLGAVLELKK